MLIDYLLILNTQMLWYLDPRGKMKSVLQLINGSNIQEIDIGKFLWILIDSKLNSHEHMKCISRKIAKGTGNIIQAFKSFKIETLLNSYNALIFPHLSLWSCLHYIMNTCRVHTLWAHMSSVLPYWQTCDFIVLFVNCCHSSSIVYLYDWLFFFVQIWQ